MFKDWTNLVLSDVPFMSALEKEKVLCAWIRFIEGGCKWTQFTNALYKHLTLHCGFIAHYNRAGFYDVYFTAEDSKARFLRQFDRSQGCKPAEGYWVLSGGNDVTQGYHDINNAMVDAYTNSKGQGVLFNG